MAERWADGPHAHEINQAMSVARTAFDHAYFQSPSSTELAINAAKAIEALSLVERLAREQIRRPRRQRHG